MSKTWKIVFERKSHFWHTLMYTANIYSQFTVIGCVACATVIWQQLSKVMTVHLTFSDTEECSLRSIAILGCIICSQIKVAHVTLPKAVLSTIKIFAVYFLVEVVFWTIVLEHCFCQLSLKSFFQQTRPQKKKKLCKESMHRKKIWNLMKIRIYKVNLREAHSEALLYF